MKRENDFEKLEGVHTITRAGLIGTRAWAYKTNGEKRTITGFFANETTFEGLSEKLAVSLTGVDEKVLESDVNAITVQFRNDELYKGAIKVLQETFGCEESKG